VRIHEEPSVAPYDEARMARLSALYDGYCRQAGSANEVAAQRPRDVSEVPCKLAPAVLRRIAKRPPH
jgi:hypothetical protein